jgi:hypothetical protein
MAIWEDFEVSCTDYLNQNFGAFAKFTHKGGADSTKPDILVETKKGVVFYIEAKHSPAQCGQFVLFPNITTREFEYSRLNTSPINKYSKMIMNYMNQSFDEYREAGTKGKEINMKNSSEIFSNWIVKIYKDKGVNFFITNNYTIIPIEDFSKYFYVTAKYRIKRSGSSDVGKGKIASIISYISANTYGVYEHHTKNSKLFVKSNQELHNQRFVIQDYEYMFSLRKNEYEIRKLSNTYNANVIFSVEYNGTVSTMNSAEFTLYLQ